ncbi:MAG: DUF4136 domain-containing protein [Verrucomicrobiota bacterium]
MNFKTALPLALAAGILSGCSSMKATSEHDKKFDFGRIETYQWIDGPEEILNEADTYITEDIQAALNIELGNQGLKQVPDTDKADVQVAYYMKLREEVAYSANHDNRDFSGGFVYSRENSSWNYAERDPDLNAYTIETGTLTVLIYDTRTGNRIWRGNLQTKIDRSDPNEKKQALIRKAAEKLIARFPKK